MEAKNPSAPKPAPFPEIPGYRIEAIVGRGSTGIVYRAVQLAVERKVALKILHPELASRGRAVRRLQREARTTARLSHAGIVTAIDMGTTNGLWWYAMELVDGPSLAEKLRRDGAMAERDAIRIFIPLCEALEHAFDEGVVHRDIKPGNILIDSTGRARIVDLGLAFAEDDPALTMQGGTLGTPHYISPEQARNPKNADVRSDIWSLGASLYHCVCGRPPFAGSSVAEILSGVLYAPVPDPIEFAPELSKALRLVLRKCLARDPERRYQHPRQLREDLEAIRERRAVSVKKSTLDPVRGAREARRRTLVASGVVALLAIAIALFTWRPWQSAQPEAAATSVVEPFGPLEDLAASARDPRKLGAALEDLQGIGHQIPAINQPRADEVRRDLVARYERRLSDLSSAFETELSRKWREQRDYVGALQWIDTEWPARLRAELSASNAQVEDARRRFADKRTQIEQEMDLALLDLYERARRHYEDVRLHGRAAAARDAHKWRTALAELQIGGPALIEESGVTISGFVPADVAVHASSLEKNVISKAVADLQRQWAEADRAAAAELRRIHLELQGALEERSIVDATGELERRWREIAPALEGEDLPSSSIAVDALAKARTDLAVVEEVNRAEDARATFASLAKDLEPLWRARKFDSVQAALQGMLSRSALQPVRGEIELMRSEATLLEGLMQRAARRLEELSSSHDETQLYVSTLPRRGRIEEGFQVFEHGFRFRPSDSPGAQTMHLALRELPSGQGTLVSRAGLEQLAGLAEPDAGDDRRYEAALLRWYLGDTKEALDLRAQLRTPSQPERAALVEALRRRFDVLDQQSKAVNEQRIVAARDLLRRIRRAEKEPSTTARKQAEWIEELMKDYGDLRLVQEALDDLKARREDLRREIERDDRERIQRAFGPSEFELSESNTVVLRYRFDEVYNGAFQRGTWRAEPEGWIAPRPRTRDEIASDRNWPTLYLADFLDLDEALDFELDFEQPADSGEARMLALSVAGVHVVFLGPGTTGQKGRLGIGAGTPEDFAKLLREVVDQGGGEPCDVFEKGKRYHLRLELRNGRGQVTVYVDGRQVRRASPTRPGQKAYGDKAVLIRSQEPVRILSARLQAKVH